MDKETPQEYKEKDVDEFENQTENEAASTSETESPSTDAPGHMPKFQYSRVSLQYCLLSFKEYLL